MMHNIGIFIDPIHRREHPTFSRRRRCNAAYLHDISFYTFCNFARVYKINLSCLSACIFFDFIFNRIFTGKIECKESYYAGRGYRRFAGCTTLPYYPLVTSMTEDVLRLMADTGISYWYRVGCGSDPPALRFNFQSSNYNTSITHALSNCKFYFHHSQNKLILPLESLYSCASEPIFVSLGYIVKYVIYIDICSHIIHILAVCLIITQ